MDRTYRVDITQIPVTATGMSQQYTTVVKISSNDCVTDVRPHSEAVRQWHSQALEYRAKSVTPLAQGRYLASLGASIGKQPTAESVTAAEPERDC